MWLFGTGVGAGIVLLGLAVILLRGLSFIPLFGLLQNQRPTAHIVSLVLSLFIGGFLYVGGCHLFDDSGSAEATKSFFNLSEALQPNKEQVMFGLAVMLLSIVVGWGLVFGAMPKNAK